MKIFLDTNVLVSALSTRGLCWDLLNAAVADPACELLVSEMVITEFTRILTVKFRAPPEKALQAADGIRQLAAVVPESASLPLPIPDPDDAPILASALTAGADFFVTGDKVLLELGAVESVAIISPRHCWHKLRGTG